MATQQEEMQKLLQETENKRKQIERTLYYDDFVKAFKGLMDFVEKAKSDLIGNNDVKGQELDEKVATAIDNIDKLKTELVNKHDMMMTMMKSDHRTFQRMIDEKIKNLEEDMPEYYDDEELEAKIEDLKTIIDSLEIPKEFDATELQRQVEENTEKIAELEKRPIGRVGGQITDRALQMAMGRIVKQETPTGTINGVNDTFVVNGTINAVLSFELGSRVVSLGSYSLTGSKRNTIVFDSAIASNYSDDSFVITYV